MVMFTVMERLQNKLVPTIIYIMISRSLASLL